MTRIEDCMCGGRIRVVQRASVQRAVAEHNGSLSHQIWRAIREGWFAASRERSTVRFASVTCPDSPNASASPVRRTA